MTPTEVGRTGWKLAAPRGGVNAKGGSGKEPPRFNHVGPTLDTVNAGALPHGNATAVGRARR